MLLLIYFIFLFFLCRLCKPSSPSLLLISIYILSLACGLMIGYDYEVDTIFKGFNLFFLAAILTILILPWNNFSYKIKISEPNSTRLRKLTISLLFINGIAFIVFVIACYYAFTNITDYGAFKNEGGSIEFNETLPINNTIYLLAIYLHSTSCFLVPIHFYYLIKEKYTLSIMCLIFSLNIILNGLTIFSRSAFVFYLFLYMTYLPFYYGKMTHKIKNIVKITALAIVVLMTVNFIIITVNRFAFITVYDAQIYSQSIIKNTAVFSIFDYASQWFKNGLAVMESYSFETMNGKLSFPLFLIIANKLQLIDYNPDMIGEALYSMWGSYSDKFNGLIANLLFDIGYLGIILFVVIYLLLLRKLKPIRGQISFTKLLMLGQMFAIPAMGIFSSVMSLVSYNTLIIFSIIIYIYMNAKRIQTQE